MTASSFDKSRITGVILAGGKARRMGGRDKGLIRIAGKPMIEYILNAIQDQVNTVIINANRNQDSYRQYGYPVIGDEFQGFNGPLAGMASALRVIDTELMVTAPCDSPYLPADLISRLYRQLQQSGADISVAHDGERIQPVFSLMKRSLLDSLLDYLNKGERKIDRWFGQHRLVMTDFSDKPETFINLNTPEDVENIEASMADA